MRITYLAGLCQGASVAPLVGLPEDVGMMKTRRPRALGPHALTAKVIDAKRGHLLALSDTAGSASGREIYCSFWGMHR